MVYSFFPARRDVMGFVFWFFANTATRFSLFLDRLCPLELFSGARLTSGVPFFVFSDERPEPQRAYSTAVLICVPPADLQTCLSVVHIRSCWTGRAERAAAAVVKNM